MINQSFGRGITSVENGLTVRLSGSLHGWALKLTVTGVPLTKGGGDTCAHTLRETIT